MVFISTMAKKNLVVELRKFLGVSQKEMAERVGMSQSDISNLERGQRGFSTDSALDWWSTYKKPLEVLGFKLEDVLRVGSTRRK